jgi:predicted GNAT family N-acyltransferase
MIVKKCEKPEEIEAALAVRKTVFVGEQRIDPGLEFDGRDDEATHFVAYEGAKAVGAARLLSESGGAVIGRLAVLPAHRRKGIGAALLRAAEEFAALAGLKTAVIHAQSHALELYKKLGYEVTSAEFEEVGIPHREMKKKLPSPREYMCKVCGFVNKFIPAMGKNLVCARCGHVSRADDHKEVL